MKKYYTISEVSKLLGIKTYQLRYLEKNLPKFSIIKLKNRRYYSQNDIAFLQSKIGEVKNLDLQKVPSFRFSSQPINLQVEQLIDKFLSLRLKIIERYELFGIHR